MDDESEEDLKCFEDELVLMLKNEGGKIGEGSEHEAIRCSLKYLPRGYASAFRKALFHCRSVVGWHL